LQLSASFSAPAPQKSKPKIPRSVHLQACPDEGAGGQLLSAKAQLSLSRTKQLLSNLDACHNLSFSIPGTLLHPRKKINRAIQNIPNRFLEGSTTEKPPTNSFLLSVICYPLASD
jgi:hypothetical protein